METKEKAKEMDLATAKCMVKEYLEKTVENDITALGSRDHIYRLPSFETTIGVIEKALHKVKNEGVFTKTNIFVISFDIRVGEKNLTYYDVVKAKNKEEAREIAQMLRVMRNFWDWQKGNQIHWEGATVNTLKNHSKFGFDYYKQEYERVLEKTELTKEEINHI